MADDLCFVQLAGWREWWAETRLFHLNMYVSVVLFFLSVVLAHPIARSLFFLVRRFTPAKWKWPDDAKTLMLWQTSLICRAGLLWIALRVSGVSTFLCQWPAWAFGVCLIIWMDSAGNVLREITVRLGIRGYNEDEMPSRVTLLYEGITLAKTLLLLLVLYMYYISPVIASDSPLRLVFSTGLLLSVGLALFPLLRNIIGAHYLFLNNMLHIHTRVGLLERANGAISDAPLGFVVLESSDRSKTFVPAGGTVIHPTTIYDASIWPLHVRIRLPPNLSSGAVRAFVQELDRRVEEAITQLDAETSLLTQTTRSLQGLLHPNRLNRDESKMTRHESPASQTVISVEAAKRWVVRLETTIRMGGERRAVVEARTKCIEQISELVEKWSGETQAVI